MTPETQPCVLYIPNQAGGTDTVQIDAVVQEQHDLVNTVTKHPVEKGADIADHSRPEPRELSLEGIQSNTPLSTASITSDEPNRARELWLRFVDLHDRPRLIAVQTIRDYYDQMSVDRVSSPVDVNSANALRFSAQLSRVTIVKNKFTQAVKAKTPAAQPKKNGGAVTTSDPSAKDNRTYGAKILDGIKGLF